MQFFKDIFPQVADCSIKNVVFLFQKNDKSFRIPPLLILQLSHRLAVPFVYTLMLHRKRSCYSLKIHLKKQLTVRSKCSITISKK